MPSLLQLYFVWNWQKESQCVGVFEILLLAKIISLAYWVKQSMPHLAAQHLSPLAPLKWLFVAVHSLSLPFFTIISHSASRSWTPYPARNYFIHDSCGEFSNKQIQAYTQDPIYAWEKFLVKPKALLGNLSGNFYECPFSNRRQKTLSPLVHSIH